MKSLDEIDKAELLQLCGEMNRFIDRYATADLSLSLQLNNRFAKLTDSWPDELSNEDIEQSKADGPAARDEARAS